MDMELTKDMLDEKWGRRSEGKGNEEIRDVDVMSYAMYPAVFDEVIVTYYYYLLSTLFGVSNIYQSLRLLPSMLYEKQKQNTYMHKK